jgi:hypothetical protein
MKFIRKTLFFIFCVTHITIASVPSSLPFSDNQDAQEIMAKLIPFMQENPSCLKDNIPEFLYQFHQQNFKKLAIQLADLPEEKKKQLDTIQGCFHDLYAQEKLTSRLSYFLHERMVLTFCEEEPGESYLLENLSFEKAFSVMTALEEKPLEFFKQATQTFDPKQLTPEEQDLLKNNPQEVWRNVNLNFLGFPLSKEDTNFLWKFRSTKAYWLPHLCKAPLYTFKTLGIAFAHQIGLCAFPVSPKNEFAYDVTVGANALDVSCHDIGHVESRFSYNLYSDLSHFLSDINDLRFDVSDKRTFVHGFFHDLWQKINTYPYQDALAQEQDASLFFLYHEGGSIEGCHSLFAETHHYQEVKDLFFGSVLKEFSKLELKLNLPTSLERYIQQTDPELTQIQKIQSFVLNKKIEESEGLDVTYTLPDTAQPQVKKVFLDPPYADLPRKHKNDLLLIQSLGFVKDDNSSLSLEAQFDQFHDQLLENFRHRFQHAFSDSSKK